MLAEAPVAIRVVQPMAKVACAPAACALHIAVLYMLHGAVDWPKEVASATQQVPALSQLAQLAAPAPPVPPDVPPLPPDVPPLPPVVPPVPLPPWHGGIVVSKQEV
jgi:hypothetical protein